MDSPYDAPFIMAELDGRKVRVPCGGAWRLFFEIIGLSFEVSDEAILYSHRDVMEYEHQRALHRIEEKLFELFNDEIVVQSQIDHSRRIQKRNYQLPVVMMKPEGVQLLIRAALGDIEARDETMRMLVELHRRRYE